MSRQISEQGLALIRRFEGFSATPYKCPAGIWTIGYGHVVGSKERFTSAISAEEADELLLADAEKAAASVRRNITAELTQAQFDALCSFVYNVGSAAFARSTLRRVINRGWHAEVPAQLRRWVSAGGRKLPGLVARREAEVELYIS